MRPDVSGRLLSYNPEEPAREAALCSEPGVRSFLSGPESGRASEEDKTATVPRLGDFGKGM